VQGDGFGVGVGVGGVGVGSGVGVGLGGVGVGSGVGVGVGGVGVGAGVGSGVGVGVGGVGVGPSAERPELGIWSVGMFLSCVICTLPFSPQTVADQSFVIPCLVQSKSKFRVRVDPAFIKIGSNHESSAPESKCFLVLVSSSSHIS